MNISVWVFVHPFLCTLATFCVPESACPWTFSCDLGPSVCASLDQGTCDPLCSGISMFLFLWTLSFAFPWTFVCVSVSQSFCIPLSVSLWVCVLVTLHVPTSMCSLLVSPLVYAYLGFGSICLWFGIYPTSPFIYSRLFQYFCIVFLMLLWLCLKLLFASIPLFLNSWIFFLDSHDCILVSVGLFVRVSLYICSSFSLTLSLVLFWSDSPPLCPCLCLCLVSGFVSFYFWPSISVSLSLIHCPHPFICSLVAFSCISISGYPQGYLDSEPLPIRKCSVCLFLCVWVSLFLSWFFKKSVYFCPYV